jgi:mono/diheme cytochrome c family protein
MMRSSALARHGEAMKIGLPRKFIALVGTAALVVAGCSASGDRVADTAPSARAGTAPNTAPPSTAAPTTDAAASGFADEVLPIIQDNCASCHTGDGSGASHMAMDTVGQLVPAANFIANAVGERYMPPWPASDAGLPFHDNRRLSDEQIQSIVDWAKASAKVDLPEDTPVVPTRVNAAGVEPDVTMTGEPYRGTLDLPDDYRCRIYDPSLPETSYLQGLEFIGDQEPVVHHALVFASTADARDAANQADAADVGPGFNCTNFVDFGVGTTTLVNSWAPGQVPLTFPKDTGIEMGAGDFFVVQIHYHYGSTTMDLPPDQSTLVADFADDATIAAAGGSLDPLTLTVLTPPAEIPCAPGVEGPLCDRATAILDSLETLAGDEAGEIEITAEQALAAYDGILEECGMTSTDVAAMTDGTARAWCTYPAVPGRIVSLWGHMHSLGSSFRMTLNPGEPDEPTDDVVLTADDTLLIECSWDRSLDAHGAEPRYILWAEGTFDEMCYSQVVVRPL